MTYKQEMAEQPLSEGLLGLPVPRDSHLSPGSMDALLHAARQLPHGPPSSWWNTGRGHRSPKLPNSGYQHWVWIHPQLPWPPLLGL